MGKRGCGIHSWRLLFPNIIFKNDEIVGTAALGRAGVVDRYQDISLFLRSFKEILKS